MRSLGYHKRISMESFRKPCFPRIAKILFWLVKRYEPNAPFELNYESEGRRIEFLQNVAKFVYDFSRVELNLRKLYRADGHSVRELLKLANILKESKEAATNDQPNRTVELSRVNEISFKQKIEEIRKLSSDLTSLGASLHDNLEDEIEQQKERIDVLSHRQTMDMDLIQEYVRKKNRETENMVKKLEKEMKQLIRDEYDLKSKKKSRVEDLERATDRLHRLSNFRPLFMDEYDKREKLLKKLFVQYVEKYRNSEYLEHEVEKFRLKEKEQRERGLRKLKRIRKEIEDDEKKNIFGVIDERSYGDLSKIAIENNNDNENNEEYEEEDENIAKYGKRPKVAIPRSRKDDDKMSSKQVIETRGGGVEKNSEYYEDSGEDYDSEEEGEGEGEFEEGETDGETDGESDGEGYSTDGEFSGESDGDYESDDN